MRCAPTVTHNLSPAETNDFILGMKGSSEAAWNQSVVVVCEYLNHVVQEIRQAEGSTPFNHCPHFPLFITDFIDSMPMTSIVAYGVLTFAIQSMRRMFTRWLLPLICRDS